MNTYLKTGIKCAVLTLWTATLSVGILLAYEQLRPSIAQADLDVLEQKLQVALLEQSTAHTTSMDSLSAKFALHENQTFTFGNDIANLNERQSSQETAFSTLEIDLGLSLNEQIRQLESRLNTKVARQQSVRSSSVVTARTPTVQKVQKPVATIKAPFALYDVQKRGLTYLAVVGKPGATHLSQLSALQEGQSYQQWRLVRVEPGRIELQKDDHRIEMEIRS